MSISGFASFVLISNINFGSHDTCPFCLWPSYTCCCSSRAPATSTYLANVHQFTFCCWLFTIFYGVPYMLVDVSYVLIVIERYMAICHPSAHQQLTKKRTVIPLLTVYGLITFAICIAQWLLLGSHNPCSNQYIKLTPYLSLVHFGLFCIFSFFQIRIVIKLRNLLRMYPSLKKMNRRVIVFRSNRSGIRSSTVQEQEPPALVSCLARFCKSGHEMSTGQAGCTCEISTLSQYLTAIRQRHMNRIEVQVTISLAVVSFPQLMFCLPYAGGLTLSFFIYLYLYDLDSYYQFCMRAQQYFQAVYLIYVICFPLLYAVLNREFRQAVKRKFNFWHRFVH